VGSPVADSTRLGLRRDVLSDGSSLCPHTEPARRLNIDRYDVGREPVTLFEYIGAFEREPMIDKPIGDLSGAGCQYLDPDQDKGVGVNPYRGLSCFCWEQVHDETPDEDPHSRELLFEFAENSPCAHVRSRHADRLGIQRSGIG
jgi:hypothetical protein